MSQFLVAKAAASMAQPLDSDTGDHCEAALSLSGRASSDASAASSLAEELQRAPGSPRTRLAVAAGPPKTAVQPPPPQARSDTSLAAPPAASAPLQQPPCYFNILVVGASNLGKTRFIANLARTCGEGDLPVPMPLQHHHHHQPAPATKATEPRIATLERNPAQLCTTLGPLELPGDPGRQLHVSLLDVPGYDCEPNKALYLAKLLEYVLWQSERDYRARSHSSSLADGLDLPPPRSLSLCLYFLPPQEVSATDLAFMSALSHELPVLPVLVLAARAGGEEVAGAEAAEESHLAALRREVVAAMMSYTRNGKPAPIFPLELDPEVVDAVLVSEPTRPAARLRAPGGVSGLLVLAVRDDVTSEGEGEVQGRLEPHTGPALLQRLLNQSVEPVLRGAAERFEDFCQRYEAYGLDLMGVLAERVEPYEAPLRQAARMDAAASAAAAAMARVVDQAAAAAAPPPPAPTQSSAPIQSAVLAKEADPMTPTRAPVAQPPPQAADQHVAGKRERDDDAVTREEDAEEVERHAASARQEHARAAAAPSASAPVAAPAAAASVKPVNTDVERVVADLEALVAQLSGEGVEAAHDGPVAAAGVAAVSGSSTGSRGVEGGEAAVRAAVSRAVAFAVAADDVMTEPVGVEEVEETEADSGGEGAAVSAAVQRIIASVLTTTATAAVAAEPAAETEKAAVSAAVQRVIASVLATAAAAAVAAEPAAETEEAFVSAAVQRVIASVLATAAAAAAAGAEVPVGTAAIGEEAAAVRVITQRTIIAAALASEAAAAEPKAQSPTETAALSDEEATARAAMRRVMDAVRRSEVQAATLAATTTIAASALAAASSNAVALGRMVARGLTVLYTTLDTARTAAASALKTAATLTPAPAAATAASRSGESDDAAVIVHRVVQRAVAAVLAASSPAAAAPTAAAAAAGPLEDGRITDDDAVVCSLVRRAVAAAVEAAGEGEAESGQARLRGACGGPRSAASQLRVWQQRGAELLVTLPAAGGKRRAEVVQYVRGFLASKPGSSGSSSSSSGIYSSRTAAGLGVGVVGLAAGTFVLLSLRHRHNHQ